MGVPIVDIRIVLGRDNALRVSIEGRHVPLARTSSVSAALAELAIRVEVASRRTQGATLESAMASLRLDALAWPPASLDALTDPASSIYTVRL